MNKFSFNSSNPMTRIWERLLGRWLYWLKKSMMKISSRGLLVRKKIMASWNIVRKLFRKKDKGLGPGNSRSLKKNSRTSLQSNWLKTKVWLSSQPSPPTKSRPIFPTKSSPSKPKKPNLMPKSTPKQAKSKPLWTAFSVSVLSTSKRSHLTSVETSCSKKPNRSSSSNTSSESPTMIIWKMSRNPTSQWTPNPRPKWISLLMPIKKFLATGFLTNTLRKMLECSIKPINEAFCTKTR